MANQPQSVTSLEVSPEEERRGRIIKYSIAQGVRVLCIIIAVLNPGGPVMWVAVAGAVLLPYFAVVIANATGSGAPRKSAPKAEAPTIAIGADVFRNAGTASNNDNN
ncbi:MAG: hypothetical protein RLZ69_611 [Actinomycetota bacterium]